MRTILRLALATLTVAAASGCGGGGGGSNAPGTLYFSQDANGNGLFLLSTSTGAGTLAGLGVTGTTSTTIGLTETNDSDFLIGSTYEDLFLINADGSGASDLDTPTVEAEGLAFHRPDGLLYTIINGDFRTVDPATGGILFTLESPPVDIEGLASDYGDGIYGIGEDSNLYRYDISLDDWAIVGDTGITWGEGAGLAYDPDRDVLYAIGSTATADTLFAIDPDDASATVVGPTGIVDTTGGLGFVLAD